MTQGVDIILEFMSVEATVVWRLLQGSHADILSGSRTCDLDGDGRSKMADLVDRIGESGRPSFGLSFEQKTPWDISYCHVRNYDHSLVSIPRIVSDVEDAWRWVAPFTSFGGFREAWVYDSDFDHWQNADDPIEYLGEDRSCEGLPMKPNGLPYPLEGMIIDTSRNPGRRVLRRGYVEAVGAVMWLGEQFWRVTGTRKADVVAQHWLWCEELPSGVLRVQVSEDMFTAAGGTEGDKQDRLRALLFPGVG